MGGPTDGCMEPPYLATEQAKAHCQSLGFLLAENPEKERVALLLEFEKRMDTVWTPRRRDRVVSTGEGGVHLTCDRSPDNVRLREKNHGSTEKDEFTEGSRRPSSVMYPGTHGDQQVWGYR